MEYRFIEPIFRLVGNLNSFMASSCTILKNDIQIIISNPYFCISNDIDTVNQLGWKEGRFIVIDDTDKIIKHSTIIRIPPGKRLIYKVCEQQNVIIYELVTGSMYSTTPKELSPIMELILSK